MDWWIIVRTERGDVRLYFATKEEADSSFDGLHEAIRRAQPGKINVIEGTSNNRRTLIRLDDIVEVGIFHMPNVPT